jgi:nucleoside-diphosphate-sugar epimerase
MSVAPSTVAVIGGAGFIGSALVRELLDSSMKVVSYDNYLHGTVKNFEGLEGFSSSKQFVQVNGDVLNEAFLKEQLKDHNVDYVINCIGDPFIPATIKNPGRVYTINAQGTLHVLKAVSGCNVKRIIHISTCEVYGINNAPKLSEQDYINPGSAYSKSKYIAEQHCREFHPGTDTSLVIVRPFNCYGPRATHPYIIPEIIQQLHKSNILRLGTITERDFTYVYDTARALVALLDANLPASSYSQVIPIINIGSGTAYRIDDIAQKLAHIMELPEDIKIITDEERERPRDIPRFVCDNTLLHQLTGWEPEVSIDEGLRKTVRWFQDHGYQWNFSRND